MNNELEKQIIIDDLIKQLNEKTIVIMLLRERLDRKEQECENLKKQLFSFMNGDYCANGCSLKHQLDQLKAENKELKEKLKSLQNK